MVNWIAKATSKHKGAFSAQARRVGMSTMAYAHHVLGDGHKVSSTTKKRAQLALTLMHMRQGYSK